MRKPSQSPRDPPGAFCSQVRRLTRDPTVDRSPAWSPDGSAIAFVSGPLDGREIYLVRADGTRRERLTVGGQSTNDMPRWSPDGSRIAYQVARGKNYDIEILRIADRSRVRFAATPAFDGQYSWSPDGAQLAFISERDRVNAVYVGNVNGGQAQRLTGTESLNPAWSR